MKIRESVFDKGVTVFEIEDGDEGAIVEAADKRGTLGFALLGEGVPTPMIVVDSRIMSQGFTYAHVLAIEAHEVGHIHRGVDERGAELRAIELLKEHSFDESVKILQERGIV
jgi:hypothetical protein